MTLQLSHIPRFLLPQYGPMWRRTSTLAHKELGPVLIRYASSTALKNTEAKKAALKTTTPKKAAIKSTEPKKAALKSTEPKKAALKSTEAKEAPLKETALKKAAKTTVAKTTATKTAAVKKAAPKTVTKVAPASAVKTPAAKAPSPQLESKVEAAPVDPNKPIVLEKPEKFNPPSHGSRLPKSTPRHYGGGPTIEEIKVQETREYPGLPPPKDTWAHWFMNSKAIHTTITLGTLTALAVYTYIQNFKATSAFADMLPSAEELKSHPITSLKTVFEVIRLDEKHKSQVAAEKRQQRVEDVVRRTEYRKAHGLNEETGIGTWLGIKSDKDAVDDASPVRASRPIADPSSLHAASAAEHEAAEVAAAEDGGKKKFLGVF